MSDLKLRLPDGRILHVDRPSPPTMAALTRYVQALRAGRDPDHQDELTISGWLRLQLTKRRRERA